MLSPDLVTQELPGRTLRTADKEYLYFSGTSYLGMGRNPDFNAYLHEGQQRYGTNYSSSRLSNVQLAIFAEAENYLAAYTGAEAALTVSSGFLAGQLVVRTLAGTGDFIYSPGVHPALGLNPTLYSEQEFNTWAQQVPRLINASSAQKIFLLFNALDPLFAQEYSMDWLQSLPHTNRNITLIIDDSHGFGITGKNGAGIFNQLQVPSFVSKIVVSSIGKALGIPAGVILADKASIDTFKKSSFFGGGSPVAPAYLYAFMQSMQLYEQARQQLQANIRYFLAKLKYPGLFRFLRNYPVFYTPQHQLYPYLLAHNILISSFSYPTPAHAPITRVILNSLHTPTDLDTLTKYINNFCAEIQTV